MSRKDFNSNQSLNLEKKVLSPKLDVVFQALFGEIGCERITRGFLKSILQEEISEIDLSQNIVLRRQRVGDKLGILDVIAKVDNREYCNIEMQLDNTGELKERILYYWSRIYEGQLKKDEKYGTLEKTIVILITNFKMKELKDLGYHSEWKIIDKETRRIILTDKLELHIIEIPKVKEWIEAIEKEGEQMEDKEEEKDKLLDWIRFLQEPLSEYVIEKTKDNEELKEAVELLKKISEDEEIQRLAWLREKAILDENSRKDYALRVGREEGLERGIKEGRKEGRKEGKKEEKLEIAKKMLKKGMEIEMVIDITGLSREEIGKIKY